jgi:glutamyl-tRNA synthetase
VHLERFLAYMESHPISQSAVQAASQAKTKAEEAKKATASSGSYSINLPGAEMGKVVTRFPPEPSGFLHLGHAKAAFLNYTIASQYKGEMILRFDDTNPQTEKEEFVINIKKDLATLGIKYNRMSHTSDYFEQCLKYGDQMVQTGKAYIDDTPVDQMREERRVGTESKCRDRSVDENMRLWRAMQEGTEEGLKCVMRAKICMTAVNTTLRDPSLYRCNLQPHHRTGTKYKVYPVYDFACPIVDSLEGVTHPLRTLEYKLRDEQYYWIIDALGIRKPHIWEFSKLNFSYTVLSKRKLQWFVNNNLVDGWFDPRFPTIQGLLRRGMTVDALRKFILSQGASVADTLMAWDKIWAMNKYELDPVVHRYNAVSRDNAVVLELSNVPADLKEFRSLPVLPKDPAGVQKAVQFSQRLVLDQADAASFAQGEEVTLMSWGNVVVEDIKRNEQGVVTGLTARLHLAGDVKKTSKKVNWICADSVETVHCTLVNYDHLITAKSLTKDQDFMHYLNPKTKTETAALGEAAMRGIKQGQHIQLQRKGFYFCDRPYVSKDKPMVLFYVPDGKDEAPAK